MTAVGLFCAGAANASGVGGAANFAPNYTFADGAKGFKLPATAGRSIRASWWVSTRSPIRPASATMAC